MAPRIPVKNGRWPMFDFYLHRGPSRASSTINDNVSWKMELDPVHSASSDLNATTRVRWWSSDSPDRCWSALMSRREKEVLDGQKDWAREKERGTMAWRRERKRPPQSSAKATKRREQREWERREGTIPFIFLFSPLGHPGPVFNLFFFLIDMKILFCPSLNGLKTPIYPPI